MATYKEFHRRSLADRDAFWREEAALIDWQTPYSAVLDYAKPPFAKWFVGGRTNLCHNAVDRRPCRSGNQKALVYLSTETNEQKAYTYRELFAEVNRFAAVLKAQGVGKGDRVLIYMPMIAEAAFAMLACARIGAIHSVVFGGFAAASLATRIDDAKPKVIGDIGCGHACAASRCPTSTWSTSRSSWPRARTARDHRQPRPGPRDEPRCRARPRLRRAARAVHRRAVPCEWLESSEPSCILRTVGQTGKPKGVQRDTGGYAVGARVVDAAHLLHRTR